PGHPGWRRALQGGTSTSSSAVSGRQRMRGVSVRSSSWCLQQPDLEPAALDLPLFQPLQNGLGQIPAHRYHRLEITDTDLADGIAGQSRLSGQGAEQVAGANLVLA